MGPLDLGLMQSTENPQQNQALSYLMSQMSDEEKKKALGSHVIENMKKQNPVDVGDKLSSVMAQRIGQSVPADNSIGSAISSPGDVPAANALEPSRLSKTISDFKQQAPGALVNFMQSVGHGITGMPIDQSLPNAGWQSKLGGIIGNEFGQSALRRVLYGREGYLERKPFSDSPSFINTPEEANKSKNAIADKIAMDKVTLPMEIAKAKAMAETKFQYKFEPGVIKDIGDAIIDGNQSPDLKGMYAANPYVRSYLAQKGFNLMKAQRDWEATKNIAKTMTNQQHSRLYETLNSVESQVPMLNKLSQDFDRYNWRPANKVELLAAVNGFDKGKSEVAVRYIGQINVMRDELAQAFSGGYAPTESSFKLADAVLDPLYNTKQMDVSLDQLKFNLRTRKNAISDTANEMLGNVGRVPTGNIEPQTPQGNGISSDVLNRAAEILRKRQQQTP